MLKTITSTVAITAAMLMTASCKPSDEELKKAIENTINNNPEIIIKALENYQKKMETEQRNNQKKALESSKEMLENDGYSLVIGNPDGDVTVIAFKDYRCGYCKRAWPSLQELVNTDDNVKVILKEMPILGPKSTLASQYGLASAEQGKYAAYYDALMNHRGAWTEEGLKSLAKSLDIDTDKLVKDAASEKVRQSIQKNLQLAQTLGVTGTPAFVVNGQLLPGAVPLAELQKLIKEARAK